jgi:hypothetical protein
MPASGQVTKMGTLELQTGETSSGGNRAEWLATLDNGIASYVDVLDAAGIETFESCEGGEGHSFPEPTIRFYGGRGEGFRALAVTLQVGPLPVKALRRSWSVSSDGEPEGPHWELTFWRPTDPLGQPLAFVALGATSGP